MYFVLCFHIDFVFQFQVEAKKAVPRDDQNILSRTSGSAHGSPGPSRTRKIFVGGLASTVTESDFKMYFEQFGQITDVVVMYDHNTQRPRGFGFITYDSEEAVDRVLTKTFHELNGKMVEVKRAVPKELSPGPSRSPIGGYNNYGLNRVNNFLNGYNPSALGGYGVRMDGRFNAMASGRSGFPPFGSGFGMGVNFEQGLNANYGGSANFGSSLSYGRGVSPYYIGNSNRFGSPVGYDGGNGGSSSLFSSTRNLWGNGGLSYGSNSSTSATFNGSGTGNVGGNFGSGNVNWGSSQVSGQGGGNAVGGGGNLSYNGVDNNYNLSGGGYGRNTGNNAAPASSSYASSNGGAYDGAFTDLYSSSSIYGDSPWRAATPERDGSSSFSYGLGNGASDVSAKGSAGFVGGYSVNKRPPNRGKISHY